MKRSSQKLQSKSGGEKEHFCYKEYDSFVLSIRSQKFNNDLTKY